MSEKIKLCNSDGKIGFDYYGVFITNPYISSCGRFDKDPIKDYGLTKKQVEQFDEKRRKVI